MYRRALPVCSLLLCALALAGQAPVVSNPASVDVFKAEGELERLRGLVQAGAIAPVRLAEAEDALGDARDDQVLRGTLFGNVTAQDLTEKQSQDMLQAAQRRYDREKAKLDRYDKLVAAGVIARNETEPFQMELNSRRITLNLAHNRAHLLQELADMARTEKAYMRGERSAQDHSLMQRFDGDGVFSPADLKRVELAYQARFHRPMPISANGETSVHRALGFDHRGRVDVAVNPDAPEGAWLRTYLERQDIPFYAFRAAIAGRATGPHIHIGPGSSRLHAAD